MAAPRSTGDLAPAPRRPALRGALLAAGAVVAASLVAPAVASASPSASTATGSGVVVSVVVPVTAPWGDAGLLDAETLATATSDTGVLTRELDELLATPATIALDPKIPASIRALGTAAPETAIDWLSRLEAASNEVFLLAWADADLTALARSDALDLARPFDLEFALDTGSFGPAQTSSPSPDPSPTPEDAAPPLPTTDDLLSWNDPIGAIAWPREGSAAATDLVAYADAGYDAVVLSSANLSEVGTARVEIDGLPVLAADSAASELLREAAATIDSAARQDAVRRLGLTLDGLAAADPGRSVVLTIDRSPTFAYPGLAEAVVAIGSRSGSQVAGLSAVLAGSAAKASVVEPTPQAVDTVAPEIVAALRDERAFSGILTEPMRLIVPRQLSLLELLAVQRVDDDDWTEAADAFLTRSAEILTSVTIADTVDVLVTSSNTSLPVRVANALDFAITVRVNARPLRPLLRVESPAEVTVEPASSATVNLPAQAITNGRVVVELTVTNPTTGQQIGGSHRVTADLQAQWETVGIIVGAVVALVFAGGLVRNVVRRRRAGRRDEATDA